MPKSKILSVGDVAERSCEKPRTLKIVRFYVQNKRAEKMRRRCVRGSLPAIGGPRSAKIFREFCLSAGVDKDHDLERGSAKSHRGKMRRFRSTTGKFSTLSMN